MNTVTTGNIQGCLDHLYNLSGKNAGLHEGKLGLCLGYLLLSRYYHTEQNYNLGVSLYKEVISEAGNIDNIGTRNGLLGIGLGINYLYLNKLIDIEIDKELYDIDDLFYKIVTLQQATSLAFENGVSGMAAYFYYRQFSQNKRQLTYRYLLHRECLILLVTEFKNLLTGKKGLLKNIPSSLANEQLLEITQSFILLFGIWKLKYCSEIIAELLRNIRDFINKSFECLANDRQRLILLYSYLFIGTATSNEQMISKSRKWFSKMDKTDIVASLDILLYIKTCNLLGIPHKNIPIRPTTLFDTFILLDSMNNVTKKQAIKWLNLWGL